MMALAGGEKGSAGRLKLSLQVVRKIALHPFIIATVGRRRRLPIVQVQPPLPLGRFLCNISPMRRRPVRPVSQWA
jgi:hypothetical protein